MRYEFLKSKKLILYLALAGAILLTLYLERFVSDGSGRLMDSIIPGAGTYRYTTDMAIVKLKLSDGDKDSLTLRIPKAYLTDSTTWRGGNVEIINIETSIPALQPARAAGMNLTLSQVKNGLMITIYNKTRINNTSKKYFYEVANKDNSFVSKNTYGLHHFRIPKPTCINRKVVLESPTTIPEFKEMALNSPGLFICWPYGDEYFVSPPESIERFISIRCPARTGATPYNRCSVDTLYKEWKIHYSFIIGEVERWREFDEKVQGLLSNFEK